MEVVAKSVACNEVLGERLVNAALLVIRCLPCVFSQHMEDCTRSIREQLLKPRLVRPRFVNNKIYIEP